MQTIYNILFQLDDMRRDKYCLKNNYLLEKSQQTKLTFANKADYVTMQLFAEKESIHIKMKRSKQRTVDLVCTDLKG